MYDSKMALAVKANNRVLREIKDKVFIPFGSEYTLLIKNLNTVKALVRVWIDGTDVTDGTSLVIQPNSSMDLERFIKNGNLAEGNKFKFIERTAAVSEHRGNKIDDGLIRLEFEFERPGQFAGVIKPTSWVAKGFDGSYTPYDPGYFLNNTSFGDSVSLGSGVQGATAHGHPNVGEPVSITRAHQSEVGITVAGSVSDQKFHAASWFPTDGVKHVMVLHVLGEMDGKEVTKPITVKTKTNCTVCGETNKAGVKFCGECGASLCIV